MPHVLTKCGQINPTTLPSPPPLTFSWVSVLTRQQLINGSEVSSVGLMVPLLPPTGNSFHKWWLFVSPYIHGICIFCHTWYIWNKGRLNTEYPWQALFILGIRWGIVDSCTSWSKSVLYCYLFNKYMIENVISILNVAQGFDWWDGLFVCIMWLQRQRERRLMISWNTLKRGCLLWKRRKKNWNNTRNGTKWGGNLLLGISWLYLVTCNC